MRPVPAHPARTDAPGHNPVRLSGAPPLVTDLSLEDLEDDARRAIGEMAYAYYSGGAEDERLLQGNVEAWSHWQLHPHVLAGISEVSARYHPARHPRQLACRHRPDGDSGAGPPRR